MRQQYCHIKSVGNMSTVDISTNDEVGDSGIIPQGALGSRNPGKSTMSIANLQTVINELISGAQPADGGMFIPQNLWDRFTTIAARAQIPA